METKIKSMILILIAVLAVAVGIIFFAMPKKNIEQAAVAPSATPSPSAVAPSPTPEAVVTESLGGEIYNKSQNPTENSIPQTNPFETKTNPFKDAYVNPFAK